MNWLTRIFGGKTDKALSPVSGGRGGWWPYIREPFTGAWQFNYETRIEDTLCYWAVFRCVSLISGDVAKMRVKVMRQEADGIPVEIRADPIVELLRRPNQYQNRIQFFENWVQSRLMRGNTYALKQRAAGGRIERLYVLDPCRVKPLVSDSGVVFYELQKDDLAGLEQAKAAVPASEIIHDRCNCFYHPLVGLSPIYAAGLNALAGLKIQSNATNFFANGSRPSGVLTAPGAISDATAVRLKEHWDSGYTGENAGKVAVLGDGLKYEQMTMSAVDAQMLEQAKWSAETVAGTFGVPAYMLNVGAAPISNNVEALGQQYYSQCLQVLIEAIELSLDQGLELEGKATQFDLEALLRMDTATMVKAEADAIGAGFKAPNEARRRFGLKPVKGGDSPMMQQQQFSLEALAERDEDKPFAKPASPAPAGPPANDNAEDRERGISLMQKGAGNARAS